jgi:hypothetical protein
LFRPCPCAGRDIAVNSGGAHAAELFCSPALVGIAKAPKGKNKVAKTG